MTFRLRSGQAIGSYISSLKLCECSYILSGNEFLIRVIIIVANKTKNYLYQDNVWAIEVPDEHSEIDVYIDSEANNILAPSQKLSLPDEIGILPLRNAVAYPGTVMPLAIGRNRSKALIKNTKANDTIIGLVAQKDTNTDRPGFSDLYKIGTAATVLKVIKLPQGSIHIVVHAIGRFKIVKPISKKPYLKAKVQALNVKVRTTKKLKALIMSVRQAANRVIALSPNVPEEAALLLENIEHPSALADFLAANLNLGITKKQELLEELDAGKRLEEISLALANQLEVLELSHKIQGKVRDSVDKSQREYFLQEQLKAIQTELGREDRHDDEINELGANIKKARMPENVEAEAVRELNRLSKIPQASPEYSVIRTYLDWMCELPWSVATEDQLDIIKAQSILNRDHYNLKKVKKRILEFLAVRKLNPTGKSPILCFIGPPGVGKTSLGRSIARAMARKFVRISLGGIRDEADIRGHRRTYIGALPGRIMQEIRKAKSNNPVFMLDEMDKIGADFRGDPASALLEVLDPEQNNSFNDHYLDQPFDLSKVMFIGTANYDEPIPDALYDRMEIIELPGYTDNEKLQIAKKYLIKRQLKENGLSTKQLVIKDEALLHILKYYNREAGVRNLERDIASICRWIATEIAKGTKRKATIGKTHIAKILGAPRYESELALRTGMPGVATGLAYTPYGGELLFVETAQIPGEGKLHLTGQIGDVMKESAEAAFSLAKSSAKQLNINGKLLTKNDFHIHVPAGAIPKDGPSAGVAMFTSLVSLLLKKPTKPDVAMTGEITLRGLVLPIGGLKEKILAAKQSGIKTVILPKRNEKDIPEVPAEAKKGMKFVYVKNTNDVLKTAL
jgi:ATP-dependent Lon protease